MQKDTNHNYWCIDVQFNIAAVLVELILICLNTDE